LRALGMAALNLDGNPETAGTLLSQAQAFDPADAIVARDLAKVLFAQADKANSAEHQKQLLARARDTLKAAFSQGKARSDFVSLLGRAQNRLGEYADTAHMLDQVRVTVWEGSREVHDLFEDAHLALGESHLAAGRPAEALTEFNRALEYPENLATGKLEHTREAHIHYLRGNALAALGRKPEAIAAWKQAADEPESKDRKQEDSRKKARAALQQAAAQ
jgi:tetratricopeptide (TPR) repeat protein